MLVHDRWAVLTVLIAAFGRAIAEVGAVMIVGGNIDGFTRVMTTTIALETSKGDLPLALALGIVLLAVVAVLNALLGLVRRGQGSALAVRSCDEPRLRRRSAVLDACAAGRVGAVRRGAGAATVSRCASSAANSWRWSAPTARARPRCCARCTACSATGQREVDAAAGAQAMVFQRPFLMRLSVLNNLRLALWLAGVPRARVGAARREPALQRVGLAGLERPAGARAVGRPAAAPGAGAGLGGAAADCCSWTSPPPASTRRPRARWRRCWPALPPTA